MQIAERASDGVEIVFREPLRDVGVVERFFLDRGQDFLTQLLDLAVKVFPGPETHPVKGKDLGGHPVERKNMRQWFLRITEYAERLLQSLETLEWSDAMKEMQRKAEAVTPAAAPKPAVRKPASKRSPAKK